MIRYSIICLLLITATSLVYWQALDFEFVLYDDDEYVSENDHVRGGLTTDGLRWAFTTRHTGYWHPLTWLSFMLDSEIYGVKPAGYHFTNIVLHVLNGLLLFGLLNHVTGRTWPSAFVAALFCLHPLNVESVAWVAERKTVLSTSLAFLALWSYSRYARDGGVWRYLFTGFILALGLIAKPMLVTLPMVFLLWDYWPLQRVKFGKATPLTPTQPPDGLEPDVSASRLRTPLRLLLEKIPLLGLSALSSIVTFTDQQVEDVVISAEIIPLHFRIANTAVSYVVYMAKMIWPRELSILYAHPYLWGTPWTRGEIIGAFVLLLVISGVTIGVARRRYVLVGWLWYLGTLVPVIGLVQSGVQGMADRYAYTSLIGLYIVIAWAGADVLSHWRHRVPLRLILALCAVGVILACSVRSWFQAKYWRDSITLFQHAREVSPHHPFIELNLGIALASQNRIDEAIPHLRKAQRITPYNVRPHFNLGLALAKKGRFDEAATYFRESISINPDSAPAHYKLAGVLSAQRKFDEAVIHYDRALEIDSDQLNVRYDLAVALTISDQVDRALEQYQKVQQLRPRWPAPQNAMAWLLATHPDSKVRQPTKAIQLAQRASALSENKDPTILDTLAAAYAADGRFERARTTAQRALELALARQADEMADQIRQRISLYEEGNPYVENR